MPRWTLPRQALQNFLAYQGVLLVVVVIAGLGLRLWQRPAVVPAMGGGWSKLVRVGGGEICGLWEMDLGLGRGLLHQAIPYLKRRNQPQTVYGQPRGFFRAFIDLTSDIDFAKPKSVLNRQLPPLRRFSLPEKLVRRPQAPGPTPAEATPLVRRDWGKAPLVAIYHTHTSESYLPDTGAPRTKGTPGGVVRVGEELAKTLWEAYGIPVVHNRTIHDYPTFRMSYVNSCETAEELVRTYPGLRVVIDLHRDAYQGGKMDNYTTQINGVPTSRVMIVVGSDKLGLPHPHWRENLCFAQELHGIMEQLYPGLSRGVRLREDGRWNQHVHPHAVILEIGEVHHSEAEARAAAQCIARVLQEFLLKEES